MAIILRLVAYAASRFFCYDLFFVCGLVKESDPRPGRIFFINEFYVSLHAAYFPVLYKPASADRFVPCVGYGIKKVFHFLRFFGY